MPGWILLAFILLTPLIANAQLLALKSGHVKGQYQLATYPDDSLVRDVIGTPAQDINADLRLLIGGGKDRWSWQGDYQLFVRSGDTLELAKIISDTFLIPGTIQNDDRRLMDLTHVISENDQRVIAHRLDRLHAGYTGDNTIVRVGRQAVSWGNGLIYNPVDFFNPFDPAAVDKEYKTGDDMVYAQHLMDSGNDWQYVSVWRRDEDGHTGQEVNTNAIKYHAFLNEGERELDVLLAQHYEDSIATVGGLSSWGGAIIRGDIVVTHTDLDTYTSGVINLSYSWTAWTKNMTGTLEYFHNGLGVDEEDYSELANHPDLVARLARGELFTLGRDYLAGGIGIEVTPLIMLTPNAFLNLEDGSGLVQLVGNYDVRQDWQLLLALNLPFGSTGTEFGGIDTGIDGKQFSNGPSLFAQLAWYF